MIENCIHSVYTLKANVYTICLQNVITFSLYVDNVYTFLRFILKQRWIG